MNTGPPGGLIASVVGLIALAVGQLFETIDDALGLKKVQLAGMGGLTLEDCGATNPSTEIGSNRLSGGLHDTRVRTDDFRSRSVPLSITIQSEEANTSHWKITGGSSFGDNARGELGY
jgi:hypothetical protein